MKKLIVGNWKMNMTMAETKVLVSDIAQIIGENPKILDKSDFLVCPPFIYIQELSELCRAREILLGSQDCSIHENGAHTGEISAQMLRDTGCEYVITGHSERRQYNNETDSLVHQKAQMA
ncbi:MAG: triosephosphate isomerase, partial [Alphaproteobacteria bacterium]|nr:triosephosphate isomerase [Alphaproteobacteria bacterium]